MAHGEKCASPTEPFEWCCKSTAEVDETSGQISTSRNFQMAIKAYQAVEGNHRALTKRNISN